MTVKLVQVTTIPMTLEFFLQGQINYMKEHGLEVIAISSPGPALQRVASRDGIQVYQIPMTRGISPLGDLAALIRLWRLFRRIRPTIVHSSTGKAGPLGMIAAALARVPVKLYCLRGVMMDRGAGPVRILLMGLEWLACRCADRVLAVSRSVADLMIKSRMCSKEKIAVPANGSSNGVDAETRFNPLNVSEEERRQFRARFNIPDHVLVIGFVGRIVAGKGVKELARAWEILKRDHQDVRMVMAGPCEAQDPVPRDVLELLRNDDRVIMIDLVRREEMPVFYRAVDLIAFPSYSEGFPNVPLEAAAMELPVVASRVTGCVDAVVDGLTGTLVPPRDSASLERAIRVYLDDGPLREAHGKAARQRVLREFRPEPVWESILSEYTGLLKTRGVHLPETSGGKRGSFRRDTAEER